MTLLQVRRTGPLSNRWATKPGCEPGVATCGRGCTGRIMRLSKLENLIKADVQKETVTWKPPNRQTERSKRGIMRLDFNIVFDCRIGGIYVLSVKHRCRASTPFAYAKAPFLHTLQKNFCPKWKSFWKSIRHKRCKSIPSNFVWYFIVWSPFCLDVIFIITTCWQWRKRMLR